MCISVAGCASHGGGGGGTSPGCASKWVSFGSFLHKSGAVEVGRDRLVLVHPNPRQTKLLTIQIGPTALGEPSSPSSAWCNGSWWLYHMSYFMEVMQEVGSGTQVGSLGGFSSGKKKGRHSRKSFASRHMFYSAVSVFPRGFPTKVSNPLFFWKTTSMGTKALLMLDDLIGSW